MTTPGRTGDAGDGAASPADTLSDLARQCADRLRRLPESRLNKVAGAAQELAQVFADAAAGVEHRDAAVPPRRIVPAVNVFALGDQVAVTAGDLGAAMAGLRGAEEVWWLGERRPLEGVLGIALTAARALRAAL